MSAGRIYWGQIVCVLGAFVASMAVTTQWTADALGHQPQLGGPDAILSGHQLYAPWKFFLWWYAFDAYAREIFETGALIFLGGVTLSVATDRLFAVALARGKTLRHLRNRALGSITRHQTSWPHLRRRRGPRGLARPASPP